jgi:hypothetical protein
MDFLPNTDNFFKYLLTVGLLLIIFTVMYPLKKQQELDLELLSYERDTSVVSFKVEHLNKKISELEAVRANTQKFLDSLKKLQSSAEQEDSINIEQIRISKMNGYEVRRKSLMGVTDSLTVAQIDLLNKSKKVAKLKKYVSVYERYKIVLLTVGFILSFLGFRYWTAAVYRDEILKDKDVNTLYKSSFVRHIDTCKGLCLQLYSIKILRWCFFAFVIAFVIICFFLIGMPEG